MRADRFISQAPHEAGDDEALDVLEQGGGDRGRREPVRLAIAQLDADHRAELDVQRGLATDRDRLRVDALTGERVVERERPEQLGTDAQREALAERNAELGA